MLASNIATLQLSQNHGAVQQGEIPVYRLGPLLEVKIDDSKSSMVIISGLSISMRRFRYINGTRSVRSKSRHVPGAIRATTQNGIQYCRMLQKGA